MIAIVVQQSYAHKKGGYGAPKTKAVKEKAKTAVKYAGPIVYTAEKPPVIYFPPPPIPAKPKVKQEDSNRNCPFCVEPLRQAIMLRGTFIRSLTVVYDY